MAAVARTRFRTAAARLLAVVGALAAAAAPAGCSHAPPDATPDGAVKLFLDDMEEASNDPRLVRKAYAMLGPAARANLEERARRTTLRQGRQILPWELLAPGRFALAFRPKAMRYAVVGDRASVEVTGDDPHSEHASVLCVHEAAGWRVEPGLPEP
jgi:hypothetical protein